MKHTIKFDIGYNFISYSVPLDPTYLLSLTPEELEDVIDGMAAGRNEIIKKEERHAT